MSESPIFEIVLLVICVATIGSVVWYSMLQKQQQNQSNTYQEALEFMAEGNERMAIQKLKDTVRENSDNINAYIQLGDLLRKRGMVTNAVRVHQDLTLRGYLQPNQQLKILKSLLKDYSVSGEFEKGISVGQKILEKEKAPENWVIEQLIRMYEKEGSWKAAADLAQRFAKTLTPEIAGRIALYHVFQGLELQNEKKFREARGHFKEALKKDPACSAALYYLGKSYRDEDRIDDAVKAWKQLCQQAPDRAHIVFPELEKAWFEIGRFADAENLYQKLLTSDQQGLNAGLALAEIYNKKGDYDAAMEVLNQLEADYPESPNLTGMKINVYFNKGQYKQAANQSLNYFNKARISSNGKSGFHCRGCGYGSENPLWICPECQELDSFLA